VKSNRAVIHFDTARESKTRWVKQAQREGLGLKDWIEKTLNAASRQHRNDHDAT
jgi:hypothetical protein